MVIADVVATTANQHVTVDVTPNVATNYRSATIELTGSYPNRPAQLTDAMRTVIMNTHHDTNYFLQASPLSPTWCTWFMPIGPAANSYELEPAPTTLINSQSSNMKIPSWQMTRVCQDELGHFWASPPLLAGPGISITGSPTGVTISGGMTYVAGGTTTLPSMAIAANDCVTQFTTTTSTSPSAAGVLVSDVVSWSMRPGPATTGYAGIGVRGIAHDNEIEWRTCNSGASAFTPLARDVNWYVLRHAVSPAAIHHRVAKKPVKKPVKPVKKPAARPTP
jgi:hypothetical protein